MNFISTPWVATSILIADWVIRLGLSIRIIMRRRAVGVSLAWLSIVLIFPFAGTLVYLLFGELRLGRRRATWAARIHGPYEVWLDDLRNRNQVDWGPLGEECESLARLCQANVGIAAVGGNRIDLLDSAEATFAALIADIDAARSTCHLEFYIWNQGGHADQVVAAIVRAAGRGVVCRLLLDAVGSSEFLRSSQAAQLRAAGVALHAALPVGLLRMLFYRLDLRMHRKIVVIDGRVAYTGSLNLVDPRFFKQGAGVGQWVDAMVRVRGPSVEALGVTFLEDWTLETGETLDQLRLTGDVHPVPAEGASVIQVVPSGPVTASQSIQSILLTAIYSARRELILTSPYFVPDELLLTALVSAARRGVDVTIVLPAKVDSVLVRFASQANKDELLEAGVRIAMFDGGLLHTKSITIDGKTSLFGSLNLDPRSLQLNFEITLAIYDRAFTAALRALQAGYVERSTPLDLQTWRSRSRAARFTDNVARLLSPLL